jgi:hypothetical protein
VLDGDRFLRFNVDEISLNLAEQLMNRSPAGDRLRRATSMSLGLEGLYRAESDRAEESRSVGLLPIRLKLRR